VSKLDCEMQKVMSVMSCVMRVSAVPKFELAEIREATNFSHLLSKLMPQITVTGLHERSDLLFLCLLDDFIVRVFCTQTRLGTHLHYCSN